MPRLQIALLALVCGIAFRTSANAEDEAKKCSPDPYQGRPIIVTGPPTDRFAEGKPLVLKDPRTALLLYLEADGRHMAAITPAGKILWHRNLFDDPKMGNLEPPPIQILPPHGGQIPPEPPVTPEEWRNGAAARAARLSIDRLWIEPDCALPEIDQPDFHGQYISPYRGHYIFAGSGTHMLWLLDAKTGDLRLYGIN